MKVEEPAIKYERLMSPQEYLEWERKQEEKHEYAEGFIITMQGASRGHSEIFMNVSAIIHSFLKGGNCRIYPDALRVYVPACQSYFYPDASIICGNVRTTDEQRDTVYNPNVIVEILSPSTRTFDLGKKFFYYSQIADLKEYITIDSEKMQVAISRRAPDNSWKTEEYNQPGQQLFIQAIQLGISLADIYSDVNLEG